MRMCVCQDGTVVLGYPIKEARFGVLRHSGERSEVEESKLQRKLRNQEQVQQRRASPAAKQKTLNSEATHLPPQVHNTLCNTYVYMHVQVYMHVIQDFTISVVCRRGGVSRLAIFQLKFSLLHLERYTYFRYYTLTNTCKVCI